LNSFSSDLQLGQTLVVGVIDSAGAKKKYGSDAVVDFVSYIADPQSTGDLVETDLKGRRVYLYQCL
jgi:hypothetical protein